MIRDILTKLGDASTWPFLQDPQSKQRPARDVTELEAQCIHAQNLLQLSDYSAEALRAEQGPAAPVFWQKTSWMP